MKIQILSVVVLGLAMTAGCSSGSGNSGSGAGGAGFGGTNSGGTGSGGAPQNCQARCAAVAQMCGEDASQCAAACQQLKSESQLKCLEAAGCDLNAAQACFQTGVGGGGGTGGTSGGGPANCVSRCETVAVNCGADPGDCESSCGSLISTEAQLQCIEGASCDPTAVAGCLQGGGQGGTSSGQGGTSSGQGGGSSGGQLGDACDCPDSGDYVQCTGPCESGLVCVELSSEKKCTKNCESQTECGSLSCTTLGLQGAIIGDYCW